MTAVAFGMLAPYAMCACAYRAANVFAFAVVIDDSSPPLFLEAAIGVLLIVASKLYIYIYIHIDMYAYVCEIERESERERESMWCVHEGDRFI